MKFTFEARCEDGSPRKFAGMWKPPFSEIDFPEYLRKTMRPSYQVDDPMKVWISGAFDKPLYEDDE